MELEDELLKPLFGKQIDLRETGHLSVHGFQVLAPGERFRILGDRRSEQKHRASGPVEARRQVLRHVLKDPQHADHRRRIDRTALGFVVQTDVPADHRRLEHRACFRDTAHGLVERVVDLQLLRVAEVEAIRDGDWRGARAHDVARCFRHRDGRPRVRVQVDHPRVAVGRQRNPFSRTGDAQHGCIAARGHHRVVQDLVVVLAKHSAFAGDIRPCEEAEERVRRIRGREIVQRFKRKRVEAKELGWPHAVAQVGRGLGGNEDWHTGHLHTVVLDHHVRAAGHGADRRAVQLPVLKECGDLGHVLLLADHQHPFLAFAQHDLVGRHARFAARHVRQFKFGPTGALRAALHHGRR